MHLILKLHIAADTLKLNIAIARTRVKQQKP
jgi:hypothetical protein